MHIEVFIQDESVWLTQKRMAELFGVEVNTVNYHIKELFKSDEFLEYGTIRKIRIIQKEGKREVQREVEFNNFDMIILVGYRANSILPYVARLPQRSSIPRLKQIKHTWN